MNRNVINGMACADAQQRLQSRLKSLAIRKPKGAASSTVLAEVAGKTYTFPSNEKKLESARIEAGPNPGELTIVTKADGHERRIEIAGDDWKKGKITSPPTNAERNIVAAGAWTSEDTYTARVVLYETPFVLNLKLRFEGDQLFYDSHTNGRDKDPQLVGRRQ